MDEKSNILMRPIGAKKIYQYNMVQVTGNVLIKNHKHK